MNLWPHLLRGIEETRQVIARGHRAVCITSPTGGGKTAMQAEFALRAAQKAKRVVMFTNRKILLEQASLTLTGHGVDHGILASGYAHHPGVDVQLASIQTIDKRVFQDEAWELPPADLVLIDEGHSNTGATASRLIYHYRESGAIVLCFTATPVGLAELYSALVVAGTYSELRAGGMLVPCDAYAPTEPDMKGVKLRPDGEYSDKGAEKRIAQCTVFGDVWDHYLRLNPFRLPTVLFAPGIRFSMGFVEQFQARGVRSEHIDGDTDKSQREDIFGRLADGRLDLVSSCGVLREGWNCPAVAHGILCQVANNLSTFIQMAGRILRAHPGKDRATLVDHAGAFWRHGAPDADRDWKLEEDDKAIRARKKKGGGPPEPICCPKCSLVREKGPACPQCGHKHALSVRHVRTVDGRLELVRGPAVRPKKPRTDADLWRAEIYAGVNGNKTLNQCRAAFERKHERRLPQMRDVPEQGSSDWHRKAAEVYPWAVKQTKQEA